MEQQRREELILKYKLDGPTELAKAKIIFDKYTHGKQPLDNPFAVIVLGQAGAGKSGVMQYSANQFPNAVAMDIDDLRLYYPGVDKLREEHPQIYEAVTGRFASAMMGILTPWLINPELVDPSLAGKHYAVVLHKTRGTEEIIHDTLIPLQKTGYDTMLRVLAVHKLESKMSCLERSLTERDNFGCCRWVETAYHDKHYGEIVNLVEKIAKEKLADSVEVFVRGEVPVKPDLVYSKLVNPKLLENPSMQVEDGSPVIADYKTDVYASPREAIETAREKTVAKIMKTYPQRLEAVQKRSIHGREDEFIDELVRLSGNYGYNATGPSA